MQDARGYRPQPARSASVRVDGMTCDHDLITDGRTIRTRKKASSSSHGTGFGRADGTEPGFK